MCYEVVGLTFDIRGLTRLAGASPLDGIVDRLHRTTLWLQDFCLAVKRSAHMNKQGREKP